jgi:hypothetical protein
LKQKFFQTHCTKQKALQGRQRRRPRILLLTALPTYFNCKFDMFVHLPISSATTLSSTIVSHCEDAIEIAMVVLNDLFFHDVDEEAVGPTNAVATGLRFSLSQVREFSCGCFTARDNSNGARLTILAPPYRYSYLLLVVFSAWTSSVSP